MKIYPCVLIHSKRNRDDKPEAVGIKHKKEKRTGENNRRTWWGGNVTTLRIPFHTVLSFGTT